MNKTLIKSIGSINGEEVKLIQLENSFSKVQILNLGCTIHSILLKDINHDIVVGPKTLDGYLQQFKGTPYYFGTAIGRHSGRISNGGFILNNKKFNLENQNGIHLHGGKNGFHKKIWTIKEVTSKPYPSVVLTCESPDMEEGYPGNLKVEATISLMLNNTFEVTYTGVSDMDSILNMTNHAYFNIGKHSIQNDYLRIFSNKMLECNKELIPTGAILPIKNTSYDFSELTTLNQLSKTGGLDNTFCYENSALNDTKVIYFSPSTGVEMKVKSNQNCTVVFAPKSLNFVKEAKNNRHAFMKYPAICFEMQNYPDAPNNLNFPSSFLKKDDTYFNKTIYEFNVAH